MTLVPTINSNLALRMKPYVRNNTIYIQKLFFCFVFNFLKNNKIASLVRNVRDKMSATGCEGLSGGGGIKHIFKVLADFYSISRYFL